MITNKKKSGKSFLWLGGILLIGIAISTGLVIHVKNSKAAGFGCNYYVSATGSSSGNGTQSAPWNLQTALNHPSGVVGGNVICVMGGVYNGSFTSHLKGSTGAPIIVRALPGQRAILDYHGINLAMAADTHDVWFWGLEVTDSKNTRDPYAARMSTGLWATRASPASHDIKFINMIVHDVKDSGMGWYESSYNSEVYGNIFYFNGAKTVDHGIYVHNQSGSKWITNNIIGDNAGYGIHGYIDGAGKYLNNMKVSGNIVYNAGSIGCKENTSNCILPAKNILLGGESGLVTNYPEVTNNYTYHWSGSGASLNLGYHGGSYKAVVANNYFMGGIFSMGTAGYTGANVYGNTIWYSGLEGVSTGSFTNNNWRTSKPTGLKIAVIPNKYEAGRANMAIYNWDKASSVRVTAADLSGCGLVAGDSYELHNSQNYFGDVIKGVYDGLGITIPMTGRSVAQPLNLDWKPATTFPEFGAFVLIRTGYGATVPSPTSIPVGANPTAIPTGATSVQTVILYPIADAYTNSGNASGNYGSDQTLKTSSGSFYMKSYLKFDLRALMGKSIVNGYLNLKTTAYASAGSSNQTLVIGLSNPDASWSESTITYANRPALGTVVASFVPVNIGNWYQADVMNLVSARVGKLVTIALSANGSDTAYFYSREAAEKPRLVLQVR